MSQNPEQTNNPGSILSPETGEKLSRLKQELEDDGKLPGLLADRDSLKQQIDQASTVQEKLESQRKLEDVNNQILRILRRKAGEEEPETQEIKEPIQQIEEAREILKDQVFGPQEIEKAFDIQLTPEQIPEIPFSQEELERARELNQFLVLRIDKTPDGTLLTMEAMNNLPQEQFQQQNKGKILYNTDWYQNEDFFIKETPRQGWALVTREIIPNSTNKNYLEQTELLVQYLKDQIFKGQDLPPEYQEAIQEFENQKLTIRQLIDTDGRKAAQTLEALRLTQLTRHTPVEVIYDHLLHLQNNNERLLENEYTWTSRRSSRGYLVDVGRCAPDVAHVLRWHPGYRFGDLGVSVSRSL